VSRAPRSVAAVPAAAGAPAAGRPPPRTESRATRRAFAALLALLLAVGCVVHGSDAKPSTLPAVPLVPFAPAAAPGAAPVTLLEAAGGKPMVIDFFATWCGPCRESMPRLQAFADEHRGRGLVVIGVDVGEDAADVAPFVTDVGVHYPIFLDKDFALADAVGAKSVPALLVVGADGRILHRAQHLDAATRAAVDAALAPPAAKR
jgi:thiol-disulfide isomerase/thioredoxin